jgi:hypothetical protein
MDWIEKLFHVSPDGGSGATEVLLMLGFVVAGASIVLLLLKVRKRRKRNT